MDGNYGRYNGVMGNNGIGFDRPYVVKDNPKYSRRNINIIIVILAIVLGFVVFQFSNLLAIKIGILGENSVRNDIDHNYSIEEFKKIFYEDMVVDPYSSYAKENKNAIENLVEEFKRSIEKGQLKDREFVKEQFSVIYDNMYEQAAQYIISEQSRRSGAFNPENMQNFSMYPTVEALIGKENIEQFKTNINSKYPQGISVSGAGFENAKNILVTEMKRLSGDNVSNAIDAIYDAVGDDYTFEPANVTTIGQMANVVVVNTRGKVTTWLIVFTVLMIGIIIAICILSKSLASTFKIIFFPLLIPSTLEAIIFSVILAVIKKANKLNQNVDVKGMINALSQTAIMPFIIIGMILIVISVMIRIIGSLLNAR